MILPEKRVFCDTSFFFASLCPHDFNYDKAGDLITYCQDHTITLLTTNDVISETITLLRYRATYRIAVDFLDNVKPSLAIVRYDESVRTAAETVFKKLSRDKRLSFCDAISYVVITHLLDNIPAFTFDKDFRSVGLMVYP
jgi:predicted nucleic acid-binding protein